MLQYATRWATLALAFTLAAPAFAQSKDDEDPVPRRAPVEANVTAPQRAGKTLPAPGFILHSRQMTPWSANAFKGGDPDLFFEDFNSTPTGPPTAPSLPDGWTQFDTDESPDGSATWTVATVSVGGVSQPLANSADQSGATDGNDDWLVTPQITVGGDNMLSFKSAQYFTPPYGSLYNVLVSTTSVTDTTAYTNVASYTEADFPLRGDGFMTFDVDLSAYAGQDVYIAFRHTGDFSDEWLLDDVAVTTGGGGTGAPGLAEDFEGAPAGGPGVLPEGWTEFSAAGTPAGASQWGVFFETTTSAPDTNNVALSRDELGTQIDYLVSPLTGISAGDFLLFDAAQQYTVDYGSVYEIRVSTTVPDDTTAFEVVASYAESDFPFISSGALSTFSVDLSAYAGQDVYVAFVHAQNFSDRFWLDNVRTAVPDDVSVESVAAAVQFNGTVTASPDSIPILGGDVVIAGESGTLEVTELTFTTAGTDDVDDIDDVIVAYTGSTPTGDPVEFGDAEIDGKGVITVTGSQEVSAGSNYFVLYYVVEDEPDTAPRLLDATFENATVDGVNILADPTTLDGAVTLILPPENDDFEDAIDLPGLSGTVTGTSVGATMQEGEPAPSCQATATGASVFWSFTAPEDASGDLTVSLDGSDFDTVLSFHDPDDLTELACDDDGGASTQSMISDFPLANGQTVLIRVSGFLNRTGAINLSYTLANLVAGEEDAATAFGLSAFRPNPTAGRTAVTLGVDQAQQVTVEVVDLLGRRVVTLHQGELAAGEVTLQVPAGMLAPGTYVVRALGETVQSMQRLTVTR